MKRDRVRGSAPFAIGLALLLMGAGARAAPSLPATVDGVFGEHIALASGAHARPVILYFMSRKAEAECKAFGRELDERLLQEAVDSVAFVDMHAYGGLLRGLASSRLRKAAEEARLHRRERRVARGVAASPEIVDRWHLVGDFSGQIFPRFGVAPDLRHPVAFVLDKSGKLAGPFADPQRVSDAVRAANGP